MASPGTSEFNGYPGLNRNHENTTQHTHIVARGASRLYNNNDFTKHVKIQHVNRVHENQQAFNVHTKKDDAKAVMFTPFWIDPRNLLFSNILRASTRPIRSSTQLLINVGGLSGLMFVAYFTHTLDSFMMINLLLSLTDLTLDNFNLTCNPKIFVGGDLELDNGA
jgi:hypothetical protein